MTLDQYKDKIKAIDTQISELHREKDLARAQFLAANAECKIGDKVRGYATHNGQEHFLGEAIIGTIDDNYYMGRVHYSFRKLKKDGSASRHIAFYSADRIEKAS